jgi:hypothetical protein
MKRREKIRINMNRRRLGQRFNIDELEFKVKNIIKSKDNALSLWICKKHNRIKKGILLTAIEASNNTTESPTCNN